MRVMPHVLPTHSTGVRAVYTYVSPPILPEVRAMETTRNQCIGESHVQHAQRVTSQHHGAVV